MQNIQHKQFTLSELIRGLDCSINGNPDHLIKGVCTIQNGLPNHITFLVNPLYKKYLKDTEASAVILLSDDAKEYAGNAIISRDPYFTYTQIAQFFDDRPKPINTIHPTAVVGENCNIDSSVSIGANAVIGNNVVLKANVVVGAGCIVGDFVEIGENSRLDARVVLYHKVKLGKRVIIASGTVVGSDGFGIAKHKGSWHKVPQLGTVIIEDDVEIGANCTIDRGAIDNTVIEQGVKLDNLIQVGHNVRIGQHTAIAGCVGIAGSTTIGSNCMIGGGSGFSGHLSIAENIIVTGGAVITKSLRQPGIYSSGVGGVLSNKEWRKSSARVHRLGQLTDKIKYLEETLNELLIERKIHE